MEWFVTQLILPGVLINQETLSLTSGTGPQQIVIENGTETESITYYIGGIHLKNLNISINGIRWENPDLREILAVWLFILSVRCIQFVSHNKDWDKLNEMDQIKKTPNVTKSIPIPIVEWGCQEETWKEIRQTYSQLTEGNDLDQRIVSHYGEGQLSPD